MKKFVWISYFLAFVTPVTAQNEIPNWNMETWDSTVSRLPAQWQLCLGTSRVAGHGGSYACQLVNNPVRNNPGVVLDGTTSNGQQFTGGIPFTVRPDSISAFFKYHIVAGDTAFILVILKKQGIPLCYQWIPIAANGALATGFTQVTRKITYSDTNSAHLPDSLIVGAICTNPYNNGVWPAGDTLIMDDISFPHVSATIPNGTFESWDSLMSYSLVGWYGYTGTSDSAYSIVRTTDKFAGAYAAIIRSIVSATDTVFGGASTTASQDSLNNIPAFKVSHRYISFSFAYKYLPQNVDSMFISAVFFKNHSIIGGAGYSSTTVKSVWTQQTIPINYYDTTGIVPDSANIFLSSGSHRPQGNSMLYIDNLSFATSAVRWNPVKPYRNGNEFSAEINTHSGTLSIIFQSSISDHVAMKLVDMSGREISELMNQSVSKGSYTITFDASHMSQGVYFVEMKTGRSLETKKLVVTR